MNKWVFINNEFVLEENACLNFRDLSIQRGYGVFDFFKAVNGIPVFLKDHLNRFFFSAQKMRLPLQHSTQEIKEIIKTLIKKNEIANCGIRITLTGGYSADGFQIAQPNLIISQHQFQSPSKENFEKGISLITYSYQRQLPQVKTIDYLMAIWLQPLVAEKNADDVLYYQNEIISECPRSNIFMITADDKIVTPANNILRGITTMKVLEIAKQDYTVEERDISMDEIKNAKEVFITSTTKMILPVTKIDDQSFEEKNLITLRLARLLTQFVAAHTSQMGN